MPESQVCQCGALLTHDVPNFDDTEGYYLPVQENLFTRVCEKCFDYHGASAKATLAIPAEDHGRVGLPPRLALTPKGIVVRNRKTGEFYDGAKWGGEVKAMVYPSAEKARKAVEGKGFGGGAVLITSNKPHNILEVTPTA